MLSLIAPVKPTLGTVFRGMGALKGLSKGLIAFAAPDGLDRFLKDVSEDAFLAILCCASVSKGGKATGEDIAARGDVGQGVGPTTARPGTVPKISYEAFQGRSSASSAEGDATLFTRLLAAMDKF